jgi:glutaredoxin 3
MPAIEIYTDPQCPHCQQLKQYLGQHDLEFTDHDVTREEAAVEEMRRIDAPGVPVIRIGGETLIGFDPERLGDALQRSGAASGVEGEGAAPAA